MAPPSLCHPSPRAPPRLLLLVLPSGSARMQLGQRPRDRELLQGRARDAFEARIQKQRGTPVVVNKWASWCGPCRLEFPFFRDQATKRKGEIAFIGVNSNDNRRRRARTS